VLLLDGKLEAKQIAARVKAFIRDASTFFDVVPWGSDQRSCCLFLSQALRGNAKVWYDEWSLSQRSLSVSLILDNLRIRFAPQIVSTEKEARQKLADRSYAMRSGENVPAYHARFEALIQDIPTITESERLFWFHLGLSAALSPKCAADLNGLPFPSYTVLVQFAEGEERRQLVERQTRSALRSNHVALQANEVLEMEGPAAAAVEGPAAKRVRREGLPGVAAAVAVGGGAAAAGGRERGAGPQGHRGGQRGGRGGRDGRGGGGRGRGRGGRGDGGADPAPAAERGQGAAAADLSALTQWVDRYGTRLTVGRVRDLRRAADGAPVCFCCGQIRPQHMYRDCPHRIRADGH
jgi:hypothetical protein